MKILLWDHITRCKPYESVYEETKLKRALNIFDLTAISVGSTLGLGVYVLAGTVASTLAGPAVILSFVIAAVTSIFSAFCYAEFAAYLPKAGSVYNYTYVTMGELLAFIIGWDLFMEYVIGTASVARGMSAYLDALLNSTISNYLHEKLPIESEYFASYPDFLSFTIILLLTVLLMTGVKESTGVNNILTVINLGVIVTVIVCGAINANFDNWSVNATIVHGHHNLGQGGFFPFGFEGVIAGAARCFYGFLGFDCIATTGEEAKNPKKDIPLAILFSMIIIILSYIGISISLTLMVPYYLLSSEAPFPAAFESIGWIEIKWFVTIGACCALTTALFGALFPMPRVLFAMSVDGIIYKFIKYVNKTTKIPTTATIISGLIAALMALTFNLENLIDMMSIGTLLAYTLVAVCVIFLRYDASVGSKVLESKCALYKQIFNLRNADAVPNSHSRLIVRVCTVVFVLLAIVLCIFGDFRTSNLVQLLISTVAVIVMILFLVVIFLQPQAKNKTTFETPWVPFFPALSILFNIFLMMHLDSLTWVRFLVWLVIGLLIYFSYGIRHSVERHRLS